LGKIRRLAARCDILVVEGVGGLLAPLGKDYAVRDLIEGLDCRVVVAGANRLGTINHTLLTVQALQTIPHKGLAIVMMGVKKPDISARNNLRLIRKRVPQIPVFSVPYLGLGASKVAGVKNNAKILKKTLALLTEDDSVGLVL
jgi:dethiobiotin synthetase